MPDYTEEYGNAITKRNNKKEQTASIENKKNGQTSPQISSAEFLIIGMIAVTNDICDWFGVDLFMFRMVDIFTAGILALWCYLRLKKFPFARFGSSFLIELFPIVGDISPTWSLFILTTYLEQRGYLSKLTTVKKIKNLFKS